MDAQPLLELVRRHLDAAGYPFALAGAFALHAHGLARETHDLDLVVPSEAQGGLVAMLEAQGFETLHRSEGYSNHLHRDGRRLDFIYVDVATGQKLFPASRRVELAGKSVLVPKPEHLIAMKVRAIKYDRSRRLRDLADVEFLLSLPGVDRDEARAYFEKAGLLDDWNELEGK